MLKTVGIIYIGMFVLILLLQGMASLKEKGELGQALLGATLNIFWFVYLGFIVVAVPLAEKKLIKHSDEGYINGKTVKKWGIEPRKEEWDSPKNLLKILFTKPK